EIKLLWVNTLTSLNSRFSRLNIGNFLPSGSSSGYIYYAKNNIITQKPTTIDYKNHNNQNLSHVVFTQEPARWDATRYYTRHYPLCMTKSSSLDTILLFPNVYYVFKSIAGNWYMLDGLHEAFN
ncbi:MAG: hypothetical protein VZR33_09205, partial [Methanosphaera sp.]|nr:hypothetical protein [Methanosphaera sp.]